MSHFLSEFHNQLRSSIQNLAPLEQVLVLMAGVVVAIFLFSLLFTFSHTSTNVWAQRGGKITEGSVGTPRFIHPLYATTNSERDLVKLIYSGLMRETEDGVFVPDLAESFTRSEDNKTYTFILRDDAVFHDGHTVSADDIVFTYTQAQTLLEAPNLRAQWQGVTVKKIDDRTVSVSLVESYADFIDQTTLGIIPEHVWAELEDEVVFSQFMIQPIGSGPFSVRSVVTNKEGLPKSFVLQRFSKFTLGAPYIRRIAYTIFEKSQDLYDAYQTRRVDNFVEDSASVEDKKPNPSDTMQLNRLFGLFVSNKSTSPAKDPQTLAALGYFIDKETLIAEALGGYASAREGVLDISFAEDISASFDPAQGYELLAEEGWTYDEETAMISSSSEDSSSQYFSFTLATSNAPHLIAVAEHLQETLATYGIEIVLDIYTSDALINEVIPERSFDVLLFGMSIPNPASVSAFWHSSQQKDPGRNITQYINNATDTLLEKAHVEHDSSVRESYYREFDALLAQDRPAIILYAPDLLYNTADRLQVALPQVIDTPHERFNMVHQWFINEARVWSGFNQR